MSCCCIGSVNEALHGPPQVLHLLGQALCEVRLVLRGLQGHQYVVCSKAIGALLARSSRFGVLAGGWRGPFETHRASASVGGVPKATEKAVESQTQGRARGPSAAMEPPAAQLERLMAWALRVARQPTPAGEADGEGPLDEADGPHDREVDPGAQFVYASDAERAADAALAVYLAASYEAYAEAERENGPLVGSREDWRKRATDWLWESDQSAAELICANEQAVERIVEGLVVMFDETPLPEPENGAEFADAKFQPGDHVLAVLAVDDTWQPAKVESMEIEANSGETVYTVRFKAFGNPQRTKESDIVPDLSFTSESEADVAESHECRICRRAIKLTFHHLIPRETHSSLLKKNRLVDPIEDLYQRFGKDKSRRAWLGSHGIMICRACHSQIHRLAPNRELAFALNTLEKLLANPAIMKWRAWAARQ
mmetsp:Transcript_7058/g.22671  ORF Transcript_7058/g.22671 Transcript_7058/m.22671 type:complete len:427 (-) Transcript_7058:224-1504(-)